MAVASDGARPRRPVAGRRPQRARNDAAGRLGPTLGGQPGLAGPC